MKKILLIVSILLLIIASLPFVGNKLIESQLNEKISIITSHGVEVKKETTQAKYLSTKKHYELVVKDSDKFVEYISNISNTQFPQSTNSILDGTTLAIDLKYDNIPVNDEISIDIYPLALSTKAIEKIKKDDIKFANYLESFLKKGGLFYHIDYSMVAKSFKGYIKDIDEKHTFKLGSKVAFKLKESTFSGSGIPIAPDSLKSNTELIYLSVRNDTNEVIANIKDISLLSSLESRTTGSSDIKTKLFNLEIDDVKTGKTKLVFENFISNFSSNTESKKAIVSSFSSLDNLSLMTSKQQVDISKVNYDIKVKNIDKDSFEELVKLFQTTKYQDEDTISLKAKKIIQKLLLRGFDFKVSDLSVKDMVINKTKNLETSKLGANIVFEPNNISNIDLSNAAKMLEKLKIDLFLDISNPMFTALSNSYPILSLARGYAKEKASSLVYDIKMLNGSISVNDKKIR